MQVQDHDISSVSQIPEANQEYEASFLLSPKQKHEPIPDYNNGKFCDGQDEDLQQLVFSELAKQSFLIENKRQEKQSQLLELLSEYRKLLTVSIEPPSANVGSSHVTEKEPQLIYQPSQKLIQWKAFSSRRVKDKIIKNREQSPALKQVLRKKEISKSLSEPFAHSDDIVSFQNSEKVFFNKTVDPKVIRTVDYSLLQQMSEELKSMKFKKIEAIANGKWDYLSNKISKK